MRRPWLSFTAFLCLLLVAVSLAATPRDGKRFDDLERDGIRTSHRRTLGLYSSSRELVDPSLHVTADFQNELRRLGLKMPTTVAGAVPSVARQGLTKLQVRYSLYAFVKETPTKAIDDFVRQIPHARRFHLRTNEQMNGTCADGRSEIDVMAETRGGGTFVSLGLQVPR